MLVWYESSKIEILPLGDAGIHLLYCVASDGCHRRLDLEVGEVGNARETEEEVVEVWVLWETWVSSWGLVACGSSFEVSSLSSWASLLAVS